MHKTLVLLCYKMACSRRRMAVQRSKGRGESRPGRHECLRHGAYAAVCSAVILVLLLLGISTLRAADLSGMWTGNGVDAGDGVPGVAQAGVILEIAQNGAEVTGSYAAPGAKPVKIENGRIEDGRIVFWCRDSRNNLITATLRMSGDWMLGRLTNAAGNVMNIALKKQ